MPRPNRWGSSLTPEEKDLFLRVACKLSGARDLDHLFAVEALRKSRKKQGPRAFRNRPPPNNLSPEHPTKRQRNVNAAADATQAPQASWHQVPQATWPSHFQHDVEEAHAPVTLPPSWYSPSYENQFHYDTYDKIRRDGITPMGLYGVASIEDLERRRINGKVPLSPHSVPSLQEQVSPWAHENTSINPPWVFDTEEQERRTYGQTPMSLHGMSRSHGTSNSKEQERRRAHREALMSPHMVSSSEEQERIRANQRAPMSPHGVSTSSDQSVSSIKEREMRRARGKQPVSPWISGNEEQENQRAHGKAQMSPLWVFGNEEQEWRRAHGNVPMSPHKLLNDYTVSSYEEQERLGNCRNTPMSPNIISSSEEQENKSTHGNIPMSFHGFSDSQVQQRRTAHASTSQHSVSSTEEEEAFTPDRVTQRRKKRTRV